MKRTLNRSGAFAAVFLLNLALFVLFTMPFKLWAPDYFQLSEEVFTEFLEKNINELKKEYYIPYAVDILMKDRGYKCEVLSTDSHWFGVTYKEDRPGVVAKFQDLANKGVYPTPLWKK